MDIKKKMGEIRKQLTPKTDDDDGCPANLPELGESIYDPLKNRPRCEHGFVEPARSLALNPRPCPHGCHSK